MGLLVDKVVVLFEPAVRGVQEAVDELPVILPPEAGLVVGRVVLLPLAVDVGVDVTILQRQKSS